jgi:hypothetical protein
MRDLRAGIDAQRQLLGERNALRAEVMRVERIKALPVVAPVRRTWRRPLVQRLAAPFVELLKRRLRGG